MHGKVTEWVGDWYDPGYYAVSATTNPLGPATGAARVIRGGLYNDLPRGALSGGRYYGPPNPRSSLQGFRLVRIN